MNPMPLHAFLEEWAGHARAAADPQFAGTWHDPAMHLTALARLDPYTDVQFALDHERQTARVLQTFPREAAHGTITSGAHAEIVPFATCHEVTRLPGLELRLMAFPFNSLVVYRIVNEVVERR
mgnify:CR=1 FL=1